jgi:hypothetical protein
MAVGFIHEAGVHVREIPSTVGKSRQVCERNTLEGECMIAQKKAVRRIRKENAAWQ